MRREKLLNYDEYLTTYNYLKQLYCTRFKWNVKDWNFSETYIENALFEYKTLGFYKDKNFGWLCLPCYGIDFNVYNEPTKYRLFGKGYSKTVDKDEIVILRDNSVENLGKELVNKYALEISDVARTCQVYLKGLKTPIILVTERNKQLSTKILIEQIDSNKPFIVLDEDLFGEVKDIIHRKHNATDLTGIFMHKKTIFDEFLSKIGIETSNIYKKAQASSDEINKNDEMTNIILADSYDCRKIAIEKLAEMSANLECRPIFEDFESLKGDELDEKATGTGENGL